MNHQYTQLYCIAILAILKITILASQLLCSYLYANPTIMLVFNVDIFVVVIVCNINGYFIVTISLNTNLTDIFHSRLVAS